MEYARTTKRKPHWSIYDGAAARMMGPAVSFWSEDQRKAGEKRIYRTQGFRPIYRVNLRWK